MTDVLLAHPFFLKNDAKQWRKMKPYPPLGTLIAASLLRDRGYSVALFDATLADEDAFEEALRREAPRVVAIYEDAFNFLNKMCLTHARQAACQMSAAARRHGALVVAAGADVTDDPATYFDSGVGFALVREPDRTLVELLEVLLGRRRRPLEQIAGLALPEAGGGVRLTAPREPERRPDSLPLPAWDLLDAAPYRAAWRRAHGYFSLNMATTRGCPFHCNWCAKPIWGQRYAMRSPAAVAEEMALVKRLLAPDHLWFADDIFGLQPRWVSEFARQVEARDASIPFMIQSRVDLMTDKAVSGLARAGCVEVWLGVESGSQKILDAMDKGTRAADVPAVRERLREAGMRACFFIQLGYPGETLREIRKTVELVRATLPDDIGVSVSYPLPGTGFFEMVRRELDGKTHWDDSNDLAMMFQGTYTSDFYRRLHELLHRDLELRQRLAAAPGDAAAAADLARLEAEWAELESSEAGYRSRRPTAIRPTGPAPVAPDLSRSCN